MVTGSLLLRGGSTAFSPWAFRGTCRVACMPVSVVSAKTIDSSKPCLWKKRQSGLLTGDFICHGCLMD